MNDNESLENSKAQTQKHVNLVRYSLRDLLNKLEERLVRHDGSKFREPELSLFAIWGDRLSQVEFGSDEYNAALKKMGAALRHHYENNRHHPEHFSDGIMGMNLIDLMEMLADWKASSERTKNTKFQDSLEICRTRFDIPDPLFTIIENTVKYMNW